jgi:hypothetical protein
MGDLGKVGVALIAIFAQALTNHRFEFAGVRIGAHDRRRIALQDGHEQSAQRLAVKRDNAGHELVHDDAKRPDVSAAVDGARIPQLFGGNKLG